MADDALQKCSQTNSATSAVNASVSSTRTKHKTSTKSASDKWQTPLSSVRTGRLDSNKAESTFTQNFKRILSMFVQKELNIHWREPTCCKSIVVRPVYMSLKAFLKKKLNGQELFGTSHVPFEFARRSGPIASSKGTQTWKAAHRAINITAHVMIVFFLWLHGYCRWRNCTVYFPYASTPYIFETIRDISHSHTFFRIWTF